MRKCPDTIRENLELRRQFQTRPGLNLLLSQHWMSLSVAYLSETMWTFAPKSAIPDCLSPLFPVKSSMISWPSPKDLPIVAYESTDLEFPLSCWKLAALADARSSGVPFRH